MDQRTKPMEKRFDKLGPQVVEALKRRHFDAYYCPTGAEAVEKVLSLIPAGDVVAWGGSETLACLGIIEKVKKPIRLLTGTMCSHGKNGMSG